MRSIGMALMAALVSLVAVGCQRSELGTCEAAPTAMGGGPRATEEVTEFAGHEGSRSGIFVPSEIKTGTAPAAAPYGHSTASDPTGGEAAAHGGMTADHPH